MISFFAFGMDIFGLDYRGMFIVLNFFFSVVVLRVTVLIESSIRASREGLLDGVGRCFLTFRGVMYLRGGYR